VPTDWYGYQTLASDGAALGLLVAGLTSSERSGMAWAGVATYALGAPVVHASHGNWGSGGKSLLLRTGSPIVGCAVGAMVGILATPFAPADPDQSEHGDGHLSMGIPLRIAAYTAIGGMVGGAAIASFFDASTFAHEKKQRVTASSTTLQWRPTVSALPGGATGGVVGQF